jgi:hypothetical protein
MPITHGEVWRRWLIGLAVLAAVGLATWLVIAYVISPGFAPAPDRVDALNPEPRPQPDSDVWGRFASTGEAAGAVPPPPSRPPVRP